MSIDPPYIPRHFASSPPIRNAREHGRQDNYRIVYGLVILFVQQNYTSTNTDYNSLHFAYLHVH